MLVMSMACSKAVVVRVVIVQVVIVQVAFPAKVVVQLVNIQFESHKIYQQP